MRKIYSLTVFITFLMLMQAQPISAYPLTGSFTNLSNTQTNYSTFEGQYLFLEGFWTECGHCIDEHPILERLYQKYKASINFLTIAVFDSDTVDTVKAFKQEHPTSWTMGVDQSLKNSMSISGTPTMIILDPTGTELDRFTGFTSEDVLDAAIRRYALQQTDVTIPLDNGGGGGGSDGPSVIGDIIASPVFRLVAIVGIAAIVYIKVIGK